MEVINKLYSSVSSTVSQLSGVLPGNPVTREFEASHHIASAGPGIYQTSYIFIHFLQYSNHHRRNTTLINHNICLKQ